MWTGDAKSILEVAAEVIRARQVKVAEDKAAAEKAPAVDQAEVPAHRSRWCLHCATGHRESERSGCLLALEGWKKSVQNIASLPTLRGTP